MKIILPLFATFVFLARFGSSLPIKAKIGPAALAKRLPSEQADLAPHINKALKPRADPTAPGNTTDPDQDVIDIIMKAMESVFKPLKSAIELEGLSLSTSLEFEKDGNVKPGGSKFDGVEFKATVEFEKEAPEDDDGDDEPDEKEVNGVNIPVDPPASVPPTSVPPATDPPVSDPPASDPPTQDAPVSDPLVVDPPASDPPTQDAPVSDPLVADPPPADPPPADPAVIVELPTVVTNVV